VAYKSTGRHLEDINCIMTLSDATDIMGCISAEADLPQYKCATCVLYTYKCPRLYAVDACCGTDSDKLPVIPRAHRDFFLTTHVDGC